MEVIPLSGNEALYSKYNLLNKSGKIKVVKPSQAKKWLATLNQSPFYKFCYRICSDGKSRILILKY